MFAAILQILLSIVPLLFGRRLFWVVVAVAGFLVGLALSSSLLAGQPQLIHIVVGLALGLIGGLLAVFFIKPMAAIGGFLALGGAALMLSDPLGITGAGRWIVFLVAGVIGVFLVLSLFDWALIINSSASGATGIAAGLSGLFGSMPQAVYLIIVLVLLAAGIFYQWREWQANKPIMGMREAI
jgi:hypothetical protein